MEMENCKNNSNHSVGIMVGEQPLKRTTVAEYLEQIEIALNQIGSLVDSLGIKINGPRPCADCANGTYNVQGISEQALVNRDKAQYLVSELAELVEQL